MTAMTALVLRDIHQPPAPPWWPPAPGWWLLAGLAAVLAGFLMLRALRRRARRRAIARMFDDAVGRASTPAAQVGAISELLRRAGRRAEPDADRLDGDAWLALLDGDDPARPFSVGPARVVLDGAFRPAVDARDVDVLRPLARRRFLQWMGVS